MNEPKPPRPQLDSVIEHLDALTEAVRQLTAATLFLQPTQVGPGVIVTVKRIAAQLSEEAKQ